MNLRKGITFRSLLIHKIHQAYFKNPGSIGPQLGLDFRVETELIHQFQVDSCTQMEVVLPKHRLSLAFVFTLVISISGSRIPLVLFFGKKIPNVQIQPGGFSRGWEIYYIAWPNGKIMGRKILYRSIHPKICGVGPYLIALGYSPLVFVLGMGKGNAEQPQKPYSEYIFHVNELIFKITGQRLPLISEIHCIHHIETEDMPISIDPHRIGIGRAIGPHMTAKKHEIVVGVSYRCV